jgi:uncharacterized membrane protein
MTVQVRRREKDSLARFLGWFSIGLGAAEVAAPRTLCRIVGASDNGLAPRVMRLMGAREIAHGAGILVRPRPTAWVASRVAGDALDLSLLGLVAVKNRRARTLFAIGNVVAVTVPDVYESRFLLSKSGTAPAVTLIRKSVSIDRPREEVTAAWADEGELRGKLESKGASVTFAEAPGDRGTELVVEFEDAPPAGDLGAAAQKLTGRDLPTQLADDLRRFKQRVETGNVVVSESTPQGHRLGDHLRQRPAQPVEEAVR